MSQEIAIREEQKFYRLNRRRRGGGTEEIQQSLAEYEETMPDMARQLGLTPPEPPNLSGGNVSENWMQLNKK